jgi:hypothetical protein
MPQVAAAHCVLPLSRRGHSLPPIVFGRWIAPKKIRGATGQSRALTRVRPSTGGFGEKKGLTGRC